ncbi:MAG: hypothetical protein QOD72_2752 [Acidimicrobiaceae bacterium]|nr:hypothetical protein [Acidimicrobiaceae bacterium]
MRRALPTLIVTLGGLALLLNFHTAGSAGRRVGAIPTTATTPAAGSSPPPGPTTRTTPTTKPGGAGGGARQLDGPVISTQFGDIQVRVILRNGKIADVQPLQMPFDRRRSQEISQAAAPLLHDEVLQAQSAQIDLISGATYTSDAFQRSLQAALDQSRQ